MLQKHPVLRSEDAEKGRRKPRQQHHRGLVKHSTSQSPSPTTPIPRITFTQSPHFPQCPVYTSMKAVTDYPVHDLIASRWSPYSFANQSVSDQDLRSLFEAARWAASSFNEQPWS